ncbi:MAG TPA: NAD(P)/FAD-dependent oxidoreductase [Aggregatilineales bacterium]|nr:NAD(P)/FAD-dependent oxidoreductase [Aggregatilineales bacterium]
MATSARPRIIIIGAGFGGLSAVNKLMRQPVDILLIDRNNFHTFTPLLYQVATCALDPSEIAYPVRGIYRKNRNISFLLGEVTAIHPQEKRVTVKTNGTSLEQFYDYLVVASGSVINFFGNESVAQFAFGLKNLQDTIILRNHILKLFEKATWTKDSIEREAMTTLVVVGGGPTGLETAGALYELYNHVLSREYNRANSIRARVVLVEATNTLLIPYPERLQELARKQLESLGVEVILGKAVQKMEQNRVILADGEVIHTHTLVWSAGVKGSPLAGMLGVELARGDRIPVKPSLEVIGLENVYAVGDIAYLPNEAGNPYAQVITVAQQQGKLTAQNIINRLNDKPQAEFVYHDKGIMATIGRRRAVAYPFNKVQLSGFFAWVTWLFLHLIWLMGFRNRITVFVNWVWNYITYDRSVRIILDETSPARHEEKGESEIQIPEKVA